MPGKLNKNLLNKDDPFDNVKQLIINESLVLYDANILKLK